MGIAKRRNDKHQTPNLGNLDVMTHQDGNKDDFQIISPTFTGAEFDERSTRFTHRRHETEEQLVER